MPTATTPSPSPTYAQFAHLNHAALKSVTSKRGAPKRWTARQLVAEADRVPGNMAHVKNPQPPNWLKGSRKVVQARAEDWRNQAREAKGRAKLRVTSPSLACAVVSWPRARENEWVPYRNAVLAYFEKSVGAGRIPGVVEHLDEANQHLHIYFVPLNDEPFGTVHPGYAARNGARRSGDKAVRVAYVTAMRSWQDALHAATGPAHGLQRVGPKRLRLQRSEYQFKQEAAKANERETSQAAELAAARTALEQREEKLKVEREQFERERSAAQKQFKLAKEFLESRPEAVLEKEIARLKAQADEVTQKMSRLQQELESARAADRFRKEAAAQRTGPQSGPR